MSCCWEYSDKVITNDKTYFTVFDNKVYTLIGWNLVERYGSDRHTTIKDLLDIIIMAACETVGGILAALGV